MSLWKKEPKVVVPGKSSAEFWQNIRPNQVILLSKALAPTSYKVCDIACVREARGLAEYCFFLLMDEDENEVVLMVKIVGLELDLCVYNKPIEDLEPGDRVDMLERDARWLFQEPKNRDWRPTDLKYTMEIFDELPAGIIKYVQKGQGELTGECEVLSTSPYKINKTEGLIATIVEYRAEVPCENPEWLIVEVGDPDSEGGGLITLLQGAPIALNDIEVCDENGVPVPGNLNN